MTFLVDGQDAPQGAAELEGASTLGVAAGDARAAALRRDQRHFPALGAEIGVQADEYGRGCLLCQTIRGAGVEADDPRWLPGDPVQVATQDLGDRIRERAHALFPTHSGMVTRHLLSRRQLPHSASAIGYQHIARHGVVAPVERDQHRSGGLC